VRVRGGRESKKRKEERKNEWKAKIEQERYIDTEVKERKKKQTPTSM